MFSGHCHSTSQRWSRLAVEEFHVIKEHNAAKTPPYSQYYATAKSKAAIANKLACGGVFW